VADPVAEVARRGVAGILAEGEAEVAEVSEHLRARAVDEGADHRPAPRGDAGQPARPRPAQQVEEDRLGLIGPGVAGGDPRRPHPLRLLPERPVARRPGLRLDVARPDRHPDALEGHPQALAGLLGGLGIVPGARPQAVVDVERRQAGERALLPKRAERSQQGGGVGPGGEGHQGAVALLEQRAAPAGVPDGLYERVEVSIAHGRAARRAARYTSVRGRGVGSASGNRERAAGVLDGVEGGNRVRVPQLSI